MGVLLEIGDGAINLIGGQDFAARGIDFENDHLNFVVIFCVFELGFDQFDHAVAAGIKSMAGDNSLHIDDRDFVAGVIVLSDHFLESRADRAAMFSTL